MMNYQYGYNNQPAFVQPQHQQVHSTQAYQGQPSSQQQQFYPSPYARIQPQQQQQQQRQQPQYAPQTGVAASMGDGGGGVGGGGMMPVGMPQQHQQHMASEWTTSFATAP